MSLNRRKFSKNAAFSLATLTVPFVACSDAEKNMFGLIGQIQAKPGQGRKLATILVEGSREMPGNIAYLVALDAEKSDLVWVTEVWESSEHHRNSLSLESVQAAIARGRDLIEQFRSSTEVEPV